MSAMVPIYAALIHKGIRTLNSIKPQLRKEVEDYLKEHYSNAD